jgi:hypothetical protein
MSSSAYQKALTAILMMLSLLGCKEEPKIQEPLVDKRASIQRIRGNAIYHWKTVFNLQEDEIAFLAAHSVKKIYVRYFDVDVENSPMNSTNAAIPIGTTVFKSSKPSNVEIVPTVFITVKSLVSTNKEGIDDLASKIYTRVCNMADFNDMGPIREIQLDCDWTNSTQDLFYSLCEKMVHLAHADSVFVSSTIRLHQLKMDPPPVDQGVLMVYNTGALRETGTKNSILDYDDVKTYLSGKSIRYGLPLDFAFPTYGWGVLFRNGVYNGILHKTDFSDETRYKKGKEGTFVVKKDHVLEGRSLWKGDVIRMEYPTADEVKKVAELVVSSIQDTTHSVILYHLDSNNLLKYTDDEISSIYGY